MDRGPRPSATMPDCTSSRTPNGSSIFVNASSLSLVPVASTVTESGATSMMCARNISTIETICGRDVESERNLISSSSRCTAAADASSTILSTLISLLSCLVTCSRGSPSTATTMVIRDTSGFSVGPTASEWMLNPRRENSDDTRASTPGLFSTRTDSVWRVTATSLLRYCSWYCCQVVFGECWVVSGAVGGACRIPQRIAAGGDVRRVGRQQHLGDRYRPIGDEKSHHESVSRGRGRWLIRRTTAGCRGPP